MAEAASVLYGVETLVEGSIAIAKGIYDPTLPLKANLIPIKDIDLPRAYHSISEVKGRAYVFGGKEDGDQLADNAMHIIILPSSGIESADYKRIEPSASSPPARYGHSAAMIDDQIYVFGGSDENGPLEERGKVWVYDTDTDSWSSLEPKGGYVPEGRTWASATASPQPQPEHRRADENIAPQMPPDPEKMVPEPLTPSTYGTFIIYGGSSSSTQDISSEVWAFDIGSRTWTQLPSPPAPVTPITQPSITLVSNRLYTFTGTQTHHLDLSFTPTGPTAMTPWTWVQPTQPHDSKKLTPSSRSAASLIPITTGQGRNYLLLLGGSQKSDIWTLQLAPTSKSAASLKDRARNVIKKSTAEEEWAEVRYYNEEGRIVQEGQHGRGIGDRDGFAACKSREIDGGTVVVWGGVESGKVRSDGLLVRVEK